MAFPKRPRRPLQLNGSQKLGVVATDPGGEAYAIPFTGGVVPPSIGGGDVNGPSSSTDNAIARFDGTTGKTIQNSGITIADGATGTLSGSNSGDQDTFKTIAVSGQSNVVADGPADTLTLIAGLNVTITTNAAGDEITFASSGGGSWIPLVDGSEPPAFITDGAGVLVLVAYP